MFSYFFRASLQYLMACSSYPIEKQTAASLRVHSRYPGTSPSSCLYCWDALCSDPRASWHLAMLYRIGKEYTVFSASFRAFWKIPRALPCSPHW